MCDFLLFTHPVLLLRLSKDEAGDAHKLFSDVNKSTKTNNELIQRINTEVKGAFIYCCTQTLSSSRS